MNALLPFALSLVAGVTLASQPLLNARLAGVVGGAAWAAGISAGLTSVVCIAGSSLLIGASGFSDAARVPWWAWLGGLFGLPSLIGMTWALPRIGAASVMVLVILGQLVTAAAIDRFGLSHAGASLSTTRILGILVVFAGVCIVLWKPAGAP